MCCLHNPQGFNCRHPINGWAWECVRAWNDVNMNRTALCCHMPCHHDNVKTYDLQLGVFISCSLLCDLTVSQALPHEMRGQILFLLCFLYKKNIYIYILVNIDCFYVVFCLSLILNVLNVYILIWQNTHVTFYVSMLLRRCRSESNVNLQRGFIEGCQRASNTQQCDNRTKPNQPPHEDEWLRLQCDY